MQRVCRNVAPCGCCCVRRCEPEKQWLSYTWFKIYIKAVPQVCRLFSYQRGKKNFSRTRLHSFVGLEFLPTLKEDILQTGHKESLSSWHMEAISCHVALLKPASASLRHCMFTRGGLWILNCRLTLPDECEVAKCKYTPKSFWGFKEGCGFM